MYILGSGWGCWFQNMTRDGFICEVEVKEKQPLRDTIITQQICKTCCHRCCLPSQHNRALLHENAGTHVAPPMKNGLHVPNATFSSVHGCILLRLQRLRIEGPSLGQDDLHGKIIHGSVHLTLLRGTRMHLSISGIRLKLLNGFIYLFLENIRKLVEKKAMHLCVVSFRTKAKKIRGSCFDTIELAEVS